MDILKSASLSIRERYFRGNSEAYGNLQDEDYSLVDPAIATLWAMLDDKNRMTKIDEPVKSHNLPNAAL